MPDLLLNLIINDVIISRNSPGLFGTLPEDGWDW